MNRIDTAIDRALEILPATSEARGFAPSASGPLQDSQLAGPTAKMGAELHAMPDSGPAAQSEPAPLDIDLDAQLDRLANTVDARLSEYQQMLSALEAVEQWFYDSNISIGAKECALLDQVRAGIKAGRA